MNNEYKVAIQSDPMRMGYNLYIYRKTYDNKTLIVQTDQEVEIPTDGATRENSLFLTEEMLQGLATALQDINVKPKLASKTEGLYEAQSEHLKDLRKLLKLN